jgi:hypothetical protein
LRVAILTLEDEDYVRLTRRRADMPGGPKWPKMVIRHEDDNLGFNPDPREKL